jgi:preprotein translocase subunit SecA
MRALQAQHPDAGSSFAPGAEPPPDDEAAAAAGAGAGRAPMARPGSGTAQPFPPPTPDAQGTFVRSERKVGRNELCPCGSGKKFKHCHGTLSSVG